MAGTACSPSFQPSLISKRNTIVLPGEVVFYLVDELLMIILPSPESEGTRSISPPVVESSS